MHTAKIGRPPALPVITPPWSPTLKPPKEESEREKGLPDPSHLPSLASRHLPPDQHVPAWGQAGPAAHEDRHAHTHRPFAPASPLSGLPALSAWQNPTQPLSGPKVPDTMVHPLRSPFTPEKGFLAQCAPHSPITLPAWPSPKSLRLGIPCRSSQLYIPERRHSLTPGWSISTQGSSRLCNICNNETLLLIVSQQ